MKKNHQRLLVAMLLFTAFPALAQVSPDAGSVRQEIEKNRSDAEQQKKTPPEIHGTTEESSRAIKGPQVTVTDFHFTGNSLLTTEQLNSAVAAYVNRPLDFSELQKAAVAVAEAYRKAGWIVRAFLPVQSIGNGAVNITVVEAMYGQTRLEGEPPTHITFERLESIVAAHQQPDAPLNSNRLDRALLLISDLPGISTAANLAAGKRERETDLVLRVNDDSMFSGNVTIDNTGSRFTGDVRASATVFANSLFHVGDQISTTYLHTQGINYAQLSGTAPIGSDGWRVGPHYSYLKYNLVAKEFSALDIHGTSSSLGLDASYPLIRARSKNLYFSLALDNSRFNNLAGTITTTKYKVSTLELGLKGHRFDGFGGGGINSAMLNVVTGKADLGGSPNEAADKATTKVNGGFSKLRYFLSRQQHLTDSTSLYVGVTGQIATKNLDSSEKFYLGGSSGLRAYPASEAGGDQGIIVNVEGRMRLPRNFSLTGFYDNGRITVNHDNNFTGAASKNNYQLQGVGVSVGWVSDFGLSVKATWAHRLGDNPHATASGMDQDGTLKKNRIWLQASMSF